MLPAGILASVQADRFVIQDFCPLAHSLEWELGKRYLHERGNKAFLHDSVPVPFAINNNGTMSRHAAELLFTSLVEAERAGPLPQDIFVLELGIGLGLFARYFLDAFRALCAQHGKDFYDRLTYVAGDRSEQMLVDVCRHGVLRHHPGRYLLRVVDALYPEQGLQPERALAGQQPRPFRAVFLNYLLDCLPAAVLRTEESGVRQLCVRTCLARGAPLGEVTDLSPAELARRARTSDPRDKEALLDLFSLFVSEYDYRPVDVATLAYGAFAEQVARAGSGVVVHNYGAIQSLERLLALVADGGFILINDYGSAGLERPGAFEHQRYTGSTFVGINFALLKAYFAEAGRCQWAEPAADSEHIYSRLLGRRLGAETVACFGDRFGKARADWLEEPIQLARQLVRHDRCEAATTAYRQALERQPGNWMLLREAALFLTFTLRHPRAGLAMARAALALNPTCSSTGRPPVRPPASTAIDEPQIRHREFRTTLAGWPGHTQRSGEIGQEKMGRSGFSSFQKTPIPGRSSNYCVAHSWSRCDNTFAVHH